MQRGQSPKQQYNKKPKEVPNGIKGITALLLPPVLWEMNDIRNIRFTGTDGLPPKIEAPHISLLDSFSSTNRFDKEVEMFKNIASLIEPFTVTLNKMSFFTHSAAKGFTLYLEPEGNLNFFFSYQFTICNLGQVAELMNLQKMVYEYCKNHFKWLEWKIIPGNFIMILLY